MHLKEPCVRGPYKRDVLYWSTNEVKELTQEKSRKLQQKAFNVSIHPFCIPRCLREGMKGYSRRWRSQLQAFYEKRDCHITHLLALIASSVRDRVTKVYQKVRNNVFHARWAGMLLLRSLYMADPSLAFRNIQQKAFAVSIPCIPSSFQVARERYSKQLRRYLQVYYEKRNCRVTIRYFGTHGVIGVQWSNEAAICRFCRIGSSCRIRCRTFCRIPKLLLTSELLLMQKLLLYQKHLSQQEHFFKVGKVFMVLLECRFLDKSLFLFLNFEKFTINGTERQLYWPW